MKISKLIPLVLCVFLVGGLGDGLAQSKKSSSSSKKPAAADTGKSKSKTAAKTKTKAEQEAAEMEKAVKDAEKLVAKLKSSQKAKFTRVVKSGKADDLIKLPGIGEKTAAAIIKARPLKSSAHLVSVKGIGPKTFAGIVDYYAKGLDSKEPEPKKTRTKKATAKKPASKKSS